jgi:hypothetical protein
MDAEKLKDASNGKLQQIRKRGQIYLSQHYMLVKDEIQEQIQKIDKEMSKCEDIEDLEKDIKELNEGKFKEVRSRNQYGRSNLGQAQDFLDKIERLKDQGKIEGNVEIKCDLRPVKLEDQTAEQLKEKIELLKTAQLCDRFLQSVMGSEAKCLMGDHTYILRIGKLEKMLAEVEAGCSEGE